MDWVLVSAACHPHLPIGCSTVAYLTCFESVMSYVGQEGSEPY